MNDKEIEAKFLDIDKPVLVAKLTALGAQDFGEETFQEAIFYDKDLTWNKVGRPFVRMRKKHDEIILSYKDHQVVSVDGTVELETKVSDWDQTVKILEHIGLVKFRVQEKRCHEFQLGEVTVGIDTWPKVPTYVELEGPSEDSIKEAADRLGLDWSKAVFLDARSVIKQYLGDDVGNYKVYTFDRIEL